MICQATPHQPLHQPRALVDDEVCLFVVQTSRFRNAFNSEFIPPLKFQLCSDCNGLAQNVSCPRYRVRISNWTLQDFGLPRLDAIWAASPTTNRGQPTPLSSDPKGERIAYASHKSIFLRNIDNPAISKQYTQHTTFTSVARFSPSGYYVASGDESGTVRVWDAVGEGATKGA